MADYSNPDTVSALATIDPELDAVSGTQAQSEEHNSHASISSS